MSPFGAGRRGGRLEKVRSHLDRVVATGTAAGYGPDPCAMWMSSVDVRTGRYPDDDTHPAHIGKRVYRNIDAPNGCTLYWDQPAIAAAYALTEQTGDASYAEAAAAYVRAFLDRCVAPNGMFLWGNHYYYDAFGGRVMRFVSTEPPAACDVGAEDGSLHELRPIRPAWEALWQVDAEATDRHIRRMAVQHVFDPAEGGFNRHADGRRGHAFLEAGGILVEAICFLAARSGDASLGELALRVADFSWRHRGRDTALPQNNPTADRWDKAVCTTEVGLWADCLLHSAEMTGIEAFEPMAFAAVAAYLTAAYDASEQRYFARLNVADGSPDRRRKSTRYQPDVYSDPWGALFPTHDYPMSLANSCVSLYKRTGGREFRLGIERWADIVAADVPTVGRQGRGLYAEHLGRWVFFLLDAADVLHRPALARSAAALADRAVEMLFCEGMFRGHTGEDRCDAVDGIGYLLLALIYLETGRRPGTMGLGF